MPRKTLPLHPETEYLAPWIVGAVLDYLDIDGVQIKGREYDLHVAEEEEAAGRALWDVIKRRVVEAAKPT